MKRYEVPVMVTLEARDQDPDWAPDSGQVAEVLHEIMAEASVRDEHFDFISIDGCPSDLDDPNSPPVPARLV